MESVASSAVVKLESGETAVVSAAFRQNAVEFTIFSGGSAWRGKGEVDSTDANTLKKVLTGSSETKASFQLQENAFRVFEILGKGQPSALLLKTADVRKMSQEEGCLEFQKSLEAEVSEKQQLVSENVELKKENKDAITEIGKLRETVEKLVPEFNQKQEDMYASFLRILNAKKVGDHQRLDKNAPQAADEDLEEEENSEAYNEDTDEEWAEMDPSVYSKEDNEEENAGARERVVRAAPADIDGMDDEETVPIDL